MKTTLDLVIEHGTVRTYAHNYTLGVDNSVYEFDKEEIEAFRKVVIAEFVKEQKPVAWLDAGGHLWSDEQRSRFEEATDKPLFTLEVNDET